MDEAYEELKNTIRLAIEYEKSQQPLSDILTSHAKAIDEDLALLLQYKPQDKDEEKKIAELAKEARRTRRGLERESILAKRQDDNNVSARQQVDTKEQKNDVIGFKLQPIKLPIFTGDAPRFRLFYDTYRDTVLNNKNIPEMGKWVYLKESLQGYPLQMIGDIPERPDTLNIALKMLADKYGDASANVTHLYKKLHELPQSTIHTETLRLTYSKLEGILLSLEALGHNVNENTYVRAVVIGKLPGEVIREIVKPHTHLSEIRQKLNEYVIAAECVAEQIIGTNTGFRRQQSTGIRQNTSNGGAAAASVRRFQCLFCSGSHWADECSQFPTVEARKRRLNNRCQRCLRQQHQGECTNIRRCVYCDEMAHNRAMCPKKFGITVEKALITPVQSSNLKQEEKLITGLFWTLMAHAETQNQKTPKQIRIVVDPASSKSFITRKAASALRLTTSNSHVVNYSGMGDMPSNTAEAAQQKVHLLAENNKQVEVDVYVVREIANDLYALHTEEFKNTYPQYKELNIVQSGKNCQIDMLLGNDAIMDVLTFEQNIKVNENLMLMPTVFGWLVIGTEAKEKTKKGEKILLITDDSAVKRLWELEHIGLGYVEKCEEWTEKHALEKFYRDIKFTDGRYEVSWPWAHDKPLINDNYGLAYGRLKSLCRQLTTKPTLFTEYDKIIQQQEADGIIERVQKTEERGSIVRYIPHHPVITQGKSTKIRPVYDASAKISKHDNSLNDCLMKGVKWLTDIVASLMRFRKDKIAAVSDVEKAFHQIQIAPKDRDAVRFLWIRDINKPPIGDNIIIMRFKRVAFGVISSPFLLYATMKYHFDKYTSKAADKLKQDMYADNLVTNFKTEESAIEFYNEVKNIFEHMGMNLTKWATNSEIFREKIAQNDRHEEIEQSVLGMKWNTEADTLHLKTPKETNMKQSLFTRRTILRQTASVFDPLGWASPIVLKAKLFIRKIWLETKTWDEKIQDLLQKEWEPILNSLLKVDQIQLNRRMFQEDDNETLKQLHAFVDASSDACAVVVYGVCQNEIAFIASRTKLAPKIKISIPRLELLAIQIGVRFINYIAESLQWQKESKKFIWSDSRCALTWVATSKILPTTVQRQVNEIRMTENIKFFYVPSNQNFADVASRGAEVETLEEMGWWRGPQWLLQRDTWPIQIPLNEAEIKEETNEKILITPIVQCTEIIEKGPMGLKAENFSSLNRLLRHTAKCLWAINKLLKKDWIALQQKDDISKARMIWLRYQQQQNYVEMKKMKQDEMSHVKNMRVFIDQEGVLRAATRIENAKTMANEVNPIILVRKTRFTRLIIMHIHTQEKHAGTAQTLAAIRREYWLPQGRREVFQTIAKECFVCRRYDAKLYAPPPPAPLPEFRVERGVKPFHGTGIDIFGPYTVRTSSDRGKPKEKRWIVIFVCTVVRAVHLEVINSMITEEILDAIRRFVARRGTPRTIISDNAPQFHVLQGHFVNLWQQLTQEQKISTYFAQNEIIWKFVPQHSPWMGGLYERIIKTIKSAIERTYGRLIMFDRQFNTSMIEIEGMVNNRPLVYIDQNQETPIITPNSFLQVHFPAIQLANATENKNDNLLRLWRASERHLQTFWELWSTHYLLSIRDRDDKLRNPRISTKQHPKEGEIVIIAEPEKKRSAWVLARVQQLIPSKDGKIRSLLLKLPNGTSTIRPVIKTAPLGLSTQPAEADTRALTATRVAVIVSAVEDDGLNHHIREVVDAGKDQEPQDNFIIEEEVEEEVVGLEEAF